MKLFYVLEGKVALHYNGERHLLEAGDSALLDGGLPHGWENLGAPSGPGALGDPGVGATWLRAASACPWTSGPSRRATGTGSSPSTAGGRAGHGRAGGRRAPARLRAEAQLLRPRRRHRAVRRGAAPALRAPRGRRGDRDLGKERVFCAGANIRMLGQSSHGWKVNFCKFTNETRNAIEEATRGVAPGYLCAVNGPCAGGGYELALACDWIVMADDGNTPCRCPRCRSSPCSRAPAGSRAWWTSAASGATAPTSSARSRRASRGKRAVEWGLVDEVVPRSRLDETCVGAAAELAARSDRPRRRRGVASTRSTGRSRATGSATRTSLRDRPQPRRGRDHRGAPDRRRRRPTPPGPRGQGAAFWPLALARELDDLILHLRINEEQIGLWVLRTTGAPSSSRPTTGSSPHAGDWLVREIRLYLKRTCSSASTSPRARSSR